MDRAELTYDLFYFYFLVQIVSSRINIYFYFLAIIDSHILNLCLTLDLNSTISGQSLVNLINIISPEVSSSLSAEW